MKKVLQKTVDFLKLCWGKFKGIGRWYRNLYKGQPWYQKIGVGFVSTIVLIVLYLVAVDVNFLYLFGDMPSYNNLKKPKLYEASELYSADGKLLGRYFNENRMPVTYEEISPNIVDALICTEDVRFYKHHGVDFQGIFAAAKDMAKGNARGASTITQQLVKNMFKARTNYSQGLLGHVPVVKMIVMKTKEMITATKIEWIYDKKTILEMYFNTVDFGNNTYGIKTAAKSYFGTTPDKLTPDQSAILVGLLKATTTYNPRTNPKNAMARRNVVLMNMVENGKLSMEQYNEYSTRDIKTTIIDKKNEVYTGKAPYFRDAVEKHLKHWCDSTGYNLYTDGLKIYTTLDTRLQAYADSAARKKMKDIQRNFKAHWQGQDPWQDESHHVIENFIPKRMKETVRYQVLADRFKNCEAKEDSIEYWMNQPHKTKIYDFKKDEIVDTTISTVDSIKHMLHYMHCSFVAMEPKTGEVKAWVGDINYKAWNYDKVTSMRQAGSTFKLFVYATAMMQGYTPCSKMQDKNVGRYVPEKDPNKGKMIFCKDSNKQVRMSYWSPTNANGYFTGASYPFKSAFAQSINSIAVQVGDSVGYQNVANTARAMGIKSPIVASPSISLGATDVNLLELVNAYATAMNDGKYHEPVLVTKIEDREGNVIYTAPTEQTQVMSYRAAYLTQTLLFSAIKEPGSTVAALWSYIHDVCRDTDFGGKTGTSNNHSDAWFVGTTPNLIGGSWVGGEYRCIHFRTGALGQGSRTALPIFGYFMDMVLKDPAFSKYKGQFKWKPNPDLLNGEKIDYSSYTCASCYVSRNDSTQNDSLAATTEKAEGETDRKDGDKSASQSSEKKKKKDDGMINFDDI